MSNEIKLVLILVSIVLAGIMSLGIAAVAFQ